MVGCTVVGDCVGKESDGRLVGSHIKKAFYERKNLPFEGLILGWTVGRLVGKLTLGCTVGKCDGNAVGTTEGCLEGESEDGANVGG